MEPLDRFAARCLVSSEVAQPLRGLDIDSRCGHGKGRPMVRITVCWFSIAIVVEARTAGAGARAESGIRELRS